MGYRIVRPEQFEWVTRPHEPGEPARHVADLSDRLGASHVRGNMWRYDPSSDGRRHRHKTREETSVVLAGTLSLYVEPPEWVDVPAGGVVVVEAGTALQSGNHADSGLVVYAYGYPPESENAELLEPAF